MTATWVALIAHSRIISNQQYIPCSLYQTCLVCDIGQAPKSKIEAPASQQCWLGMYSTCCMPGNINCAGAYHHKPDVILVEKSDQLTDSISWMSPKVIAEYTTQPFKPSMPLVKTLHTKAYLIFLDQPWRHFVLALSIAKQEL